MNHVTNYASFFSLVVKNSDPHFCLDSFFFFFLGPHLQQIPGLGVQLELQLQAYATAIAQST